MSDEVKLRKSPQFLVYILSGSLLKTLQILLDCTSPRTANEDKVVVWDGFGRLRKSCEDNRMATQAGSASPPYLQTSWPHVVLSVTGDVIDEVRKANLVTFGRRKGNKWQGSAFICALLVLGRATVHPMGTGAVGIPVPYAPGHYEL
jgi:hypothetical protein